MTAARSANESFVHLFKTVRGRLVSADSGFLAPLGVGAVMYLACQCFAGMLL